MGITKDLALDFQNLWAEKVSAILKPIPDLCLCTFAFGGLLFFWFGFSPEVDWAKGKMNPGQTPQDAYRYKQYRFNNNYINCDGVEADPKTQCQSPVIPAVTAQE